MNIIVSQEIETVCPGFVGAAVEADVVNSEYNAELWAEINDLGEKYKAEYTTETVKTISGIEATRRVYRACGKVYCSVSLDSVNAYVDVGLGKAFSRESVAWRKLNEHLAH